jgi:mono/diheme cytochrome c family protein
MHVQEAPPRPSESGGTAAAHSPWRWITLGVALGIVGCGLIGAVLGGPAILAKRGDLPLERIYGDFAVSVASRLGGGNQQNPVANDRRALAAGRDAYTGSCSVCHGANGDGRGVLGTSSYPNATDLRSHDAVEKSDAQLFWIIKNGLNFTGMPGFADQYSDQDIWSMVTFIRALQDPNQAAPTSSGGQAGGSSDQPGGGPNRSGGEQRGRAPQPGQPAQPPAGVTIPAPTFDQLDRADPLSPDPAARGAALYFAQGCNLCHGAVGEAPGNLGLSRGGGPEALRAIRQGRPGMPRYSTAQLSDAELGDLQAYMATIGSTQRRGD